MSTNNHEKYWLGVHIIKPVLMSKSRNGRCDKIIQLWILKADSFCLQLPIVNMLLNLNTKRKNLSSIYPFFPHHIIHRAQSLFSVLWESCSLTENWSDYFITSRWACCPTSVRFSHLHDESPRDQKSRGKGKRWILSGCTTFYLTSPPQSNKKGLLTFPCAKATYYYTKAFRFDDWLQIYVKSQLVNTTG